MATAGSIVLDLLLRTGSFETDTQRATKAAEKRFKELQKSAQDSAASISKAFAGIFSGALLGVSAGAVFSKFIEETKNAQNEQAQLAAALRSTGSAAGYTISQLNAMASEFSNKSVFSEGDINRAQTRLLSYTGIVGEQFPKALQAAIDTAQRMGMTVEQAAETVGRALDIPSQGLSSLSKQGFRFTEDQKKLVEQLEKTGQTAKAQQIILDALESSYGGAAEAARHTLGGALQALQNQIDDLMTGDDGSVNGLTSAINEFTDLLGSSETKQAFASFLEGITSIATKAVQMINDFAAVTEAAGGFVEALAAFSAGDNLLGAFRSAEENIAAAKDELAELAAMQERLNEGTAKWNDYNQKSLDTARRAAEARLAYYQSQVNRREASVFGAYNGVEETGAGTVTLPVIPVTANSGGGRTKKEIDQGQKFIEQLQKQIALTGELTERQKLQIQIEQGYVKFRSQGQQDAALAAADTLDFINEQNKAYEESQKRAADLAKLLDDLYPSKSVSGEYLKDLTLLTDSLQAGAISASDYYDAVDRLDEKFTETADSMSQFSIQAARNIQDSLGDGLYDLLTGNFDNIGQSWAKMILKMVADAQAAQLAKALFGDYGNSGQIGGLVGSAFGSFFGGASSGVASATAADVGAAGGGLMFLADGGYTGPGGKYDVAGVVHAGEYVINADATRKLGLGYLDRLNGYADGGYVGAPPGPSGESTTRVEIINNGTPQRVTGAERSMDIKGEIIRIFVDDMRRNGQSAKAVRGVVGA